ncbi:hypothetical protein SESBI_21859 [Sesbania bispinosa]|nr:hypothetical protein SESBI_21859 [Sesbania bispinosa]
MGFSVAFYHMGKFVLKPRLHYKGGEIHVFHGLDMDTWSYFEALGSAKDLGYVDKVIMWWKEKWATYKKGLKQLMNDEDALELTTIAENKKCEMEIYLEHSLSNMANFLPVLVTVQNSEIGSAPMPSQPVDNLNEEPNVHPEGVVPNVHPEVVEPNVDPEGVEPIDDPEVVEANVDLEGVEPNVDPEGVDSDCSEDSVRDVHFDDSEEERAIGADDGFSMPEVGQVEADLNERVRNAQNDAGYAGERSGVASGNGNANVGGFAPPDVANMHNMEGNDVESLDGNEETRNNWDTIAEAVHSHQCSQLSKIMTQGMKMDQHRELRHKFSKLKTAHRDLQLDHNRVHLVEGNQMSANNPNREQTSKAKSKQPAATKHTQKTKKSQVKDKGKQPMCSQQSQNSQATTRVTRSALASQKSNETSGKTATTSTSKANTNKRKSDNQQPKPHAQSKKPVSTGGSTTKRGRKKSNQTGPAIPEFARNMTVGQLVREMSRVWEQHKNNLRAAESAQGPSPSTQLPPTTAQIPATSTQVPTVQPPLPTQGESLEDLKTDGRDGRTTALNEARGSGSSNEANKDKEGSAPWRQYLLSTWSQFLICRKK